MKKVIVLGAGLIGKTIAADLCRQHDVTCADFNDSALQLLSTNNPVKTIQCDFTNGTALQNLIQPFDLVIAAVPGFMGFETLRTIIEAGKNVVDISFFPENPFDLDSLAKKNNVTAIVDCGVAPGMCNIIAGYHNEKSKLVSYECLVGGLPVVREKPYEYKAVFSPIDVIEEYTRPARYIENGKQIVREALSDAELVHFENIGTLESFNTDGLRSLADTMPHVPNMKEKTLRYPGHIQLMHAFRETGFFDKNEIEFNGMNISPLQFTSRILFPKWKMKNGDEDFTIMRVTVENKQAKYVYTLLDRFDSNTHTTSMARTTAFTCTAAANLVLSGIYSRVGICPPEYLGEVESCFSSIMNYLAERNVHYQKETINKSITNA